MLATGRDAGRPSCCVLRAAVRIEGIGDRDDSCMSDARWIEVEDDVRAAAEHFYRARQLFDRGGFDDPDLAGYIARMAFMHSMQSGHTSLESGLVRLLEMLGEETPAGKKWRADLIKRAARGLPGRRPAILGSETAAASDGTRRFRNVATRNYNNFRPEQAASAVLAADIIVARLAGEIAAFRGAIDPADDDSALAGGADSPPSPGLR